MKYLAIRKVFTFSDFGLIDLHLIFDIWSILIRTLQFRAFFLKRYVRKCINFSVFNYIKVRVKTSSLQLNILGLVGTFNKGIRQAGKPRSYASL